MIRKLCAALVMVMVSVVTWAQIVNPRITTDSSVDTFSVGTVVNQITNAKMTDEQKVIACWRFMLDHYYHWTPSNEPDVPKNVRDFTKAINSYGYGPCFQSAPVMSALWEACGFSTRNWTISGHSIAEVKYGGAWHMLDADTQSFHRKADGQIASVSELSRDAKLITDPPGGKSDPFYPLGKPDEVVKPHIFWGPPSKMMDLYLSRKNNYQYNRRAVMAHPMYLVLRQGERLTLNRKNVGKFYMPPKADPEHINWKGGPREVKGKYTYGNGEFLWAPNFSKISGKNLLWFTSKNVKIEKSLIVPTKAGEPCEAVFRVRSPYALLQAEAQLVVKGLEVPACAVSFDGGAAWADVPGSWQSEKPSIHQGVLDLSPHIAGRYDYLVKVSFRKGSIMNVSFRNLVQLSQMALPRLKPGKNKITVLHGPDEGVVQLVRAKGKQRKDRYIVKSENLDPKSVRPATRDGKPGSVVYKLLAPDVVTAISMGANMTMDPGKPFQMFEAFYSMNDGKTWHSAWKIPNHKNWGNSQFDMDKRIRVENSGRAQEVLFKFVMKRSGKYFSINSIRLYVFYELSQPKGPKLAVDFAWEEKKGDQWTEKKKSFSVDHYPYELQLKCGGEAARVSQIVMKNEG